MTKDTATQLDYLNKLFLNRTTVGQKVMIQARRYTSKNYIDAINQKQHYLSSIRNNTYKAGNYADIIGSKVAALKKLYPNLKSATFEMDELKPNRHYQLVIGQGFRDLNSIRIKPYLIDFKTGAL